MLLYDRQQLKEGPHRAINITFDWQWLVYKAPPTDVKFPAEGKWRCSSTHIDGVGSEHYALATLPARKKMQYLL
jgi:hypothetical protein